MLHRGSSDQYEWMVSDRSIWSLPDLVLRFHQGMRLCIATFDGGRIHPTDEEAALGWQSQGEVMVSPPMHNGLVLPYENFDEWYIFAQPAPEIGQLERFVNFGQFTLVPPEQIYENYDPTWEKPQELFEALDGVQKRFWSQLVSLNPQTFVAMGANDVVVSQDRAFIQAVADAAQPGAAGDAPQAARP